MGSRDSPVSKRQGEESVATGREPGAQGGVPRMGGGERRWRRERGLSQEQPRGHPRRLSEQTWATVGKRGMEEDTGRFLMSFEKSHFENLLSKMVVQGRAREKKGQVASNAQAMLGPQVMAEIYTREAVLSPEDPSISEAQGWEVSGPNRDVPCGP